ncbi:BrnA antitoxin family protein [Rhodobacteraceae bacterium]|nr:BrnA antitoxin family protein [Paracoccaceae bacterium]
MRWKTDDLFLDRARRLVPDAWHMIEMDVDVSEPKEKLTLYLDKSVAKMFKAMGHGYQARINRILATWVQMQIADVKVIEMGYIEALEATRGERDAEVPQDVRGRRAEALEEHWAYLQGVLDQERVESMSKR